MTHELPPRVEPPVGLALRWYAVRVAPQCEARAHHDLRAAGVVSWVPTYRQWVNRRRGGTVARWRHVERPLLVGYILVGVRSPADWSAIRTAEGYAYTVSADGDPVEIPLAAVVDLSIRVHSGTYDEDCRPKRRRNPHRRGDRVTVSLAGLTDVPAVVTHVTGENILVELVDSGLKARIGVEAVSAGALNTVRR